MGKPTVNEIDNLYKDLLQKQFKHFKMEPEPSLADGWLPLTIIQDNPPKGWTPEMVRRYYESKTKKGEAEKMKWSKNVYYRIVPQEEVL